MSPFLRVRWVGSHDWGLVPCLLIPSGLVCETGFLMWCDGGRAPWYSFTLGGGVVNGSIPFPNRGFGDDACSSEVPESSTFPALVQKSRV